MVLQSWEVLWYGLEFGYNRLFDKRCSNSRIVHIVVSAIVELTTYRDRHAGLVLQELRLLMLGQHNFGISGTVSLFEAKVIIFCCF